MDACFRKEDEMKYLLCDETRSEYVTIWIGKVCVAQYFCLMREKTKMIKMEWYYSTVLKLLNIQYYFNIVTVLVSCMLVQINWPNCPNCGFKGCPLFFFVLFCLFVCFFYPRRIYSMSTSSLGSVFVSAGLSLRTDSGLSLLSKWSFLSASTGLMTCGPCSWAKVESLQITEVWVLLPLVKAALDGLVCGELVFSFDPTCPFCVASAQSGELLLHPAELAEKLQRTPGWFLSAGLSAPLSEFCCCCCLQSSLRNNESKRLCDGIQ